MNWVFVTHIYVFACFRIQQKKRVVLGVLIQKSKKETKRLRLTRRLTILLYHCPRNNLQKWCLLRFSLLKRCAVDDRCMPCRPSSVSPLMSVFYMGSLVFLANIPPVRWHLWYLQCLGCVFNHKYEILWCKTDLLPLQTFKCIPLLEKKKKL